jgi:hypothetical protein
MGTPAIAVPSIVSQRTAYVPEQPIVVPISPETIVPPVIRTIPSQIIVSNIVLRYFRQSLSKKDSLIPKYFG